MKIRYVTGDLLASDELIILQGCNSHGVGNSGIARAIRERYPTCFETYRSYFLANGLKLGEIVWWTNPDKTRIIGNAITQENYGRDHRIRYCSYDAIAKVIEETNNFARAMDAKTVGLPLIGCGLGNGRWSIVSQIIEEHSENFQPIVYLLDGKIPL